VVGEIGAKDNVQIDMLRLQLLAPPCRVLPSAESAALCGTLRLKCDGTRAETRFRLSAKRTSQLKSAGASVQSTAGSRGVRISGSNVGYTTFRGSVGVLATHSIRHFPLHFPPRGSPCAFRFQTHSTFCEMWCHRQLRTLNTKVSSALAQS